MVRYRLDDLGWYQFECLCQSVLKAELGLSIESWGGASRDRGRDAYCPSPLPFSTTGTFVDGPFVFQAKFVSGATAAGAKAAPALKKAIRAESAAIARRVTNGEWDDPAHYVLLTNVVLTPELRDYARSRIGKAGGGRQVTAWGAGDICDMLDRAPSIRVAFPQILGLRDISALLQAVVAKPVLERSTLLVERAAELAQVFVPTEPYNQALALLARHRFVVLIGAPEVGKTTIARIIGLAKQGEGWECYECRSPEEFFQALDRRAQQIFIADDAFGSTEYDPAIGTAWARDMDAVLRSLGGDRWFIWTSRSTILKIALGRLELQGRAVEFPEPAELLVDVGALTQEERALILYRHAKAAGLEEPAKRLVRQHASSIIRNEHFTPERVRRFVSDALPELARTPGSDWPTDPRVRSAIDSAISQPTPSMTKSFKALPPAHRTFLIAMLDAGPGLTSEDDVREAYDRLTRDDSPPDAQRIAEELDAHFIRRARGRELWGVTGRMRYEWVHPSWRELVVDHLVQNPGDRRTFLRRCSVGGLVLALSTKPNGGGSAPPLLLIDEGDWMAAQANATRLAESSSDTVVTPLLDALLDALNREEVDRDPRPATSTARLPDLAGAILDACSRNWSSQEGAVAAHALSVYYCISVFVEPLPPSPDLRRTWHLRWEAARNELSQADQDATDLDADAAGRWVELIRLLSTNDARFLVQVGYPDSYLGHIAKFLHHVRKHAEPDRWFEKEEQIDECEEEIYRLEQLKYLVAGIGELVPGLQSQAKRVAGVVERTRLDCELQLAEIAPPEAEYEPDGYPPRWRRPRDVFEVRELFRDL